MRAGSEVIEEVDRRCRHRCPFVTSQLRLGSSEAILVQITRCQPVDPNLKVTGLKGRRAGLADKAVPAGLDGATSRSERAEVSNVHRSRCRGPFRQRAVSAIGDLRESGSGGRIGVVSGVVAVVVIVMLVVAVDVDDEVETASIVVDLEPLVDELLGGDADDGAGGE